MSVLKLRDIPLHEIEIGANVRRVRDEQHVKAIAASARDKGILVPIEVELGTKLPFLLVDGWHRLGACELLGRTTIPAMVCDDQHSEAARIERQLCINTLRFDLNAVEKATNVDRLISEYGWTLENASARLGLSKATLSRLLAIRTLPEPIQAIVATGRVSADAAYLLSRVTDALEQQLLCDAVAAGQLTRDALSDRVKRRPQPEADGDKKNLRRVTAQLTCGFALSFSGPEVTFDAMIEQLERFIGRARKLRRQGVELSKFIGLLNAEARTEVKP